MTRPELTCKRLVCKSLAQTEWTASDTVETGLLVFAIDCVDPPHSLIVSHNMARTDKNNGKISPVKKSINDKVQAKLKENLKGGN